MKRKSAFIVAILVTLGIFLISIYHRPDSLENVVVKRALDGDTLDLADGRRIRLLNINAPEKGEYYSDEAKNYLQSFENQTVEIQVTGMEKYGRFLGKIYVPEYLNLYFVRNGFARSFLVSEDEVAEFKTAQRQAQTQGLGIWRHSAFYGCLNVQMNKKEEYLDIVLVCNTSAIGWTVGDESTKKYIIKKDFDNVRLYSGEGSDDAKRPYWGVGNVWNDDRDSLFIRDKQGLLIYYYQYGY